MNFDRECPKYGRCPAKKIEGEIKKIEYECVKIQSLITNTNPNDTRRLDSLGNKLSEHENNIAYKNGEIFNVACDECPLG